LTINNACQCDVINQNDLLLVLMLPSLITV